MAGDGSWYAQLWYCDLLCRHLVLVGEYLNLLNLAGLLELENDLLGVRAEPVEGRAQRIPLVSCAAYHCIATVAQLS